MLNANCGGNSNDLFKKGMKGGGVYLFIVLTFTVVVVALLVVALPTALPSPSSPVCCGGCGGDGGGCWVMGLSLWWCPCCHCPPHCNYGDANVGGGSAKTIIKVIKQAGCTSSAVYLSFPSLYTSLLLSLSLPCLLLLLLACCWCGHYWCCWW